MWGKRKAYWQKHSSKMSYTGHRKFLPTSHPFRNDKSNLLHGSHERRTKPAILFGPLIQETMKGIYIYEGRTLVT